MKQVILSIKPEYAEKIFSGEKLYETRFFDYFNGKDEGYALKIKNIQRYETPKALIDYLCYTAPQSFAYYGS